MSVALYASGFVGSSIRVTTSLATCSPTRSWKMLRPLITLSPLSVPPMIPRKLAVTYGSRTTVSRRDAGFVAPSSRVARSAASRAALARSKSDGDRPTVNPKPVCVSPSSSASVDTTR